jgi:hypothetical protein
VKRCPLARHGLGSDLLAACPGFDPVHVSIGHGPGAGLDGQTCGHMGSGTTGRGFAATCLHPEGDRVMEAARLIATTIPTRARRRDGHPVLADLARPAADPPAGDLSTGRPATVPSAPATRGSAAR